MIVLRFRQLRGTMQHAVHGDWQFEVRRVPNYTRSYPAMVYDFAAKATQFSRADRPRHFHRRSNRAREVRRVHQQQSRGFTVPETVTIPFSLGDKVRDKLTGFSGYVHAVAKPLAKRAAGGPAPRDEAGLRRG